MIWWWNGCIIGRWPLKRPSPALVASAASEGHTVWLHPFCETGDLWWSVAESACFIFSDYSSFFNYFFPLINDLSDLDPEFRRIRLCALNLCKIASSSNRICRRLYNNIHDLAERPRPSSIFCTEKRRLSISLSIYTNNGGIHPSCLKKTQNELAPEKMGECEQERKDICVLYSTSPNNL